VGALRAGRLDAVAAHRLRTLARRCAASLALLLAGCAVHHVSPDDPAAQVPDRSPQIALGTTARPDVRHALGAPLLASTYWGFDLFRASTEQSEVAFAITPWPVPFARLEDEIQRYTLVAYDDRGVASALATGLFRKPAAWRNTAPIESNFRALHLRAGNLLLFADPEGARDVNVLAAPATRDAYFERARHAPGCTVVMGCAGRGCPDRVKVDAAPARRLPLRTAHVYWIDPAARPAWLGGTEAHGGDAAQPWLETLVAVALPAGEHVLAFSAQHLAGSASATVACRPGDVITLTLDAVLEATFWHKSLVDWQITPSTTLPVRFARRALVLIDDGKWTVENEPAQ
jgi:hypothetical protein